MSNTVKSKTTTRYKCLQMGNAISEVLNKTPSPAIQAGNQYMYDFQYGVVLVNPNGQTKIVVPNNGKNDKETFEKLQTMKYTLEVLQSLGGYI